MKTVCCSGHRPKGLPWGSSSEGAEYDKYLKTMTFRILTLIDEGYTHFISGAALGVDMDFAEIVLYYRDKRELPVTLECAIPCDNQTAKWSEDDKLRCEDILSRADKITQVGTKYTMFCMQKRNEYMVDNSDFVLVVWNGIEKGGTWNTLNYAKRKKKLIELIEV